MAEIATIARPYAEALLKAVAGHDLAAVAADMRTLSGIAADPTMRQFADNPKVTDEQVLDVIGSVASTPLGDPAKNLLRTVIENGRMSALPEIAAQFQALVDDRSGTSQAVVHSAYPLSDAQLADVQHAMEARFGRKLDATVVVDPALIGGVRVVVGDEVLDTSIRARLEQMKAALVA